MDLKCSHYLSLYITMLHSLSLREEPGTHSLHLHLDAECTGDSLEGREGGEEGGVIMTS